MKHAAQWAIGLSVLALAGAAAAQYGGGYDDSRGRSGRSSATFFVKDDFGGRSVVVDRPVRSFREFDMNDKVSSIGIQGGRWLVCADDDFRGRCEVIDHSIRKLGGIGMDDMISSARPLDRGDDRGGGRGDGSGRDDRGGDYARLPGGSWQKSCRAGRMSGRVLQAQCDDGRGRWQGSEIDPRQCPSGRIGNRYGALSCE